MNHKTVVGAIFAANPIVALLLYGRTRVRAILCVNPIEKLLAPIVRLVGAIRILQPSVFVPRWATFPLQPTMRVPAGA